MAAIPALSKTYSARGNVPFADVSSTLNLARSCIFNLIRHLLDTATGGTTSGTRDANSVWTVKGSSDGVANVSVSGMNHIAAQTNLVWAAAATNHSWIWLENATLGYQLVIDCINVTTSNVVLAAAPIAAPFTGGTLANRPVNLASEFLWGTNSTGDSQQDYFGGDLTLGGARQTQFVTSIDGQFLFLAGRTGTGLFHTCVGIQKTTGGAAGDTRNVFWVGHSSASSRGAPADSSLAAPSGISGRSPNGTNVVNSGGGDRPVAGSSTLVGSSIPTTDSQTGKTNIWPVPVYSAMSLQYSYRGILPDWYFVPPHTIGTSIPSTAAQTRIVAGDFIVPFPGVVPNV